MTFWSIEFQKKQLMNEVKNMLMDELSTGELSHVSETLGIKIERDFEVDIILLS